MLGLTLSDLYPCEAWSFTFGKFLPGHGEPAPRQPLPQPCLGGESASWGAGAGQQVHRSPNPPGKDNTLPGNCSRTHTPKFCLLSGRDLAVAFAEACWQGWASRTHASRGQGGFAPRLPVRCRPCVCFLPEVGVCSFARFSGDLLPSGPGASDPASVEVATDDPVTPVQDGGPTVSFSALGMVQCCKVGRKARAWGRCTGRGEGDAAARVWKAWGLW